MLFSWVYQQAVIIGGSTPITSDDILKKLFPNGWSFLINFLALIVLFLAVYFIAYKPVKKNIEARKDYVEHNIRDSEKAKAINERKAAESDRLIEDARKEGARIVGKAKANAEVSAKAITDEAMAEAVRKKKDADLAIAQAEEASKEKVRREIVDVALAASKQVIGRELGKSDNEKLVSDFVKEVKKGEKDV
ncbi:MAG: ATP synthase F0 subunit B [Bacilli bacterium]|jgi:F-type H+-transporting ATPase subunit b|nr:ATP synthase F0 subunit B [Bacilli bacterium]